ncbi:hypothetical protein E2562_022558 [Oryza meyeriana var. granulata]|uniref:Uncharacterized protein n=1 Tax=Oryza meyeriana var. granulata TaxID=110450 RepID=A0A6G1FB33_9ORYZ|nr:hypothetical protein E2562_022558 [Oryza meyeriana var. granulata]
MIKQLQGKLEVLKHMPGEDSSESRKKIDELKEELQDKCDEMDTSESLLQDPTWFSRKGKATMSCKMLGKS